MPDIPLWLSVNMTVTTNGQLMTLQAEQRKVRIDSHCRGCGPLQRREQVVSKNVEKPNLHAARTYPLCPNYSKNVSHIVKFAFFASANISKAIQRRRNHDQVSPTRPRPLTVRHSARSLLFLVRFGNLKGDSPED